jgi:hypothetical protein
MDENGAVKRLKFIHKRLLKLDLPMEKKAARRGPVFAQKCLVLMPL